MLKYILFLFGSFVIQDVAAQSINRINFIAQDVYPEGTAYYAARDLFFVSSVTTGTIGTVDAAGTYTVFYEDHSLKSSYGMKVDTRRNKLWVCTGDANYSMYSEPSTYKKLARLISLDLTSGQKIDDINFTNLLPGKHFLNDLTLDAAGNIYITDSYSPVIYKVNLQLNPSVFSQDSLFKSIDVGLNGIAWHPNGYLIVAHNTNGALYKVRLNNPAVVETVAITNFFPGADGLLFDNPAATLSVVQNKGANKVYQLKSTNNWTTATVVARTLMADQFDNPTTLTKKGSQLYALNAKLNELTDPVEPPSKHFSLQKVKFVSMQ